MYIVGSRGTNWSFIYRTLDLFIPLLSILCGYRKISASHLSLGKNIRTLFSIEIIQIICKVKADTLFYHTRLKFYSFWHLGIFQGNR